MLKSLSVWGLNVVKGRSSGSNRIATHRLWLTIMGILSVTLIVSVSSAQQTTRWNNPNGGYWDVAANWDNGVPDPTKIAVIDLPGTYTVTIRLNAVAAGLILGNDDPSDTGTKALQVGASFTLNGNGVAKSRTVVALFQDGTLTGSGTLRVEGELRLSYSSVQEGSGVTWIATSGKLTTELRGGTTTLRRRLVNEGSVEIGLLSGTRSGGVLRLGQGGVLENKGILKLRSYDLDTASILPADAPNAGKVVNENEGVIESVQDSSRDTYITARLENRGTVRSRSRALYLSDVVFLEGSRIGAGEGTVRLAEGGRAEVAEGATALVESGASFVLDNLSGSNVLTGSGTLRVEGELHLGHGSIQEGSGVTWIAPSGKLTTELRGGTTTLRRRLVNEGSVEIGLNGTYSGGVIRIGQGGILENKGTLKLKSDYYAATIAPVSSTDSGKLVNKGTILKQEGDNTAYINVELRNEGKVQVSAGTLQVSTYYQTQTGSLEIGIAGTQTSEYGQMNVTGTAWLNGTLFAELLNDFSPDVGTSFRVLSVGRRTGDFRRRDLPGDIVPEWTDTGLVLRVAGGFFVSNVEPIELSNLGTIQLTVKGSGFQSGVTVLLKKEDTTVTASQVTLENIRLLRAQFVLDNIPTGRYDIVVRAPDGQEAKLASAVTVYDERVLSIIAVDPEEVVQSPTLGIVTFQVRGTQFGGDVQVYLERLSENRERILPVGVQVNNPMELQATFDLSPSNAKIGMYHLVIARNSNQARHPVFVFPYMAVMSCFYNRPQVLVVGRVTRHTIQLTNFGNATGVGVVAVVLPTGFELKGVYPGVGGEWSAAGRTVVIAQPVQPYETVTIGIDARLPWENVVPPNQQPEEGKYRLGDKVLFHVTLLASPIQELWGVIKSQAGNNWEEIAENAMMAHGAITGMWMGEFMELKMAAGHEFIMRLGRQYPFIADVIEINLEDELYAYAANELGVDLFEGQRGRAGGDVSSNLETYARHSIILDTLDLTVQDFLRGKIGAMVVATTEGILEGFTFGVAQLDLTEKYAQNLGYNSLEEMKQDLGIEGW